MAPKAASGRKKLRSNYSPEFSRTLAQEGGVNVNMLFKWRPCLLAGKFDTTAREQAMLLVAIIETSAVDAEHGG